MERAAAALRVGHKDLTLFIAITGMAKAMTAAATSGVEKAVREVEEAAAVGIAAKIGVAGRTAVVAKTSEDARVGKEARIGEEESRS